MDIYMSFGGHIVQWPDVTVTILHGGHVARWPCRTVAILHGGHIARWPCCTGAIVHGCRIARSILHETSITTSGPKLRFMGLSNAKFFGRQNRQNDVESFSLRSELSNDMRFA